jgi:ribosomal protein S18 acetylase RimI-like enzyme
MTATSGTVNLNPGNPDFSRTIKRVEENNSRQFFAYLDAHLRASGTADVPLFQPAPRAQSGYLREKEASFIEGLSIAVGNPKWRRAWVAVDTHENILGHVDLRARMEPCSSHRAHLGMGVRIDLRRNGIGGDLLDFVTEWARHTGIVEIIDLEVLSPNFPAISLYEQAGFKRICEVEDMFRIDGQSVSHIMMTKRLHDV